uniref:Reverse transcriptase zinc-binding domain-containing protein n=1 Tax=Latimeria chalumnae TaxID=7897 RepID=H3A8A9_LATCH
EKGINQMGETFDGPALMSFMQLQDKYQLPQTHFYRYLQFRHYPESKLGPSLERCISQQIQWKGFISSFYEHLQTACGWPRRAWEADLDMDITPEEWETLNKNAQRDYICAKHRIVQYKILRRIYYTPAKIHRLFPSRSPLCVRCKSTQSDLMHVLWSCPNIQPFWKQVCKEISGYLGTRVEPDTQVCILSNHPNTTSINKYQKQLASLALITAKKLITVNWKTPAPPQIAYWKSEIGSYAPIEKLIYKSKGAKVTYNRIWAGLWRPIKSLL